MSKKVIDVEGTCCDLCHMFEERNLKARDIQEALGFESMQAVYKWTNLRRKSMPSINSLVQLAELMDCSIEDILVVKSFDE